MAGKRHPYPKMSCAGYTDPVFSHENKAGMTFSVHYCEGCGASKIIPDIHAPSPPGPPMFFGPGRSKDGCGCNKRRELTDYFDACQKCNGPIYLTPGAAMYRKIQGASYQPRPYCSDCLDAVVFSGPCRNAGCASIGGTGQVEVTLRDQLFYETKQFTFPPNNCATCRRAIKAFKRRKEVRPTCALCAKPFRVTDGVMIMMLKNESECEIPKMCFRCRMLAPDERRRLEQERLLTEFEAQRRKEIARLFAGDKAELERERQRRFEAGRDRETKVRELIRTLNRLPTRNVRETLHNALSGGVLAKVLADPKHPNHRITHEALAHVLGGKGSMTTKEFNALPEAARLVFERYPKTYGLFEAVPKYRGKGSSPLHQHYELLSAAALMTTAAKSTSGKTLFINSLHDKVDFGVKFPRETGVFGAKSKTNEADILVWRPPTIIPPTVGREIAIDSKHTLGQTYTPIPHEQLKGIREGFNLGKFHEFYFVSNMRFGSGFVREVQNTNVELVRDFISQSGKQIPSDLGTLDKFDEKYKLAIEKYVAIYDVPQIEMCEYVKFRGT